MVLNNYKFEFVEVFGVMELHLLAVVYLLRIFFYIHSKKIALPSLACSHTTSIKSFTIRYLDRNRDATDEWRVPILNIPIKYYTNHYCDPSDPTVAANLDRCNFVTEAGTTYSGNWVGFNSCLAPNYSGTGPQPLFGYSTPQNYCFVTPAQYNCNVMVDLLLNENASDNRLGSKQDLINSLSDLGCNVTVEQGRTKSNCVFSTTDLNPFPNPIDYNTIINSDLHPKVFGWENVNVWVRKNIVFQQQCYIVPNGTDPVWKPLCCNIGLPKWSDITRQVAGANGTFPQLNPLTVNNPLFTSPRSLTGKECDVAWCQNDPLGVCAPTIVQACKGTSSCNRHNFLSRYNPSLPSFLTPNQTLLLNNISVTGFIAGNGVTNDDFTQGLPLRGFWCNAWYNHTRYIATNLGRYGNTDASSALSRVLAVQGEISRYCNDPSTAGAGECSCLRGYQSLAADFLAATPTTASTTFFNVPTLVSNQSRRIDLFCDASSVNPITEFTYPDGSTYIQNNSAFFGTLTVNGTVLSKPCSSFTAAGQYPILKGSAPRKFPTLNPMQSVLAQTNYGDVMRDAAVNKNQGIPYRCWLPACTNPQTLDSVFSDLLSYSITCPSVCYAYSGANNINLTNVNANVLSIGNFLQECNFPGNEPQAQLSPFLLPFTAIHGFQFNIPQGFTGSLSLQVMYPQLDTSALFVSKTMYAVTELPTIIDVTPNTALIYKYSVTQFPPYNALVGATDTINLSLSVDARNQTVKYLQTNLWLSDNVGGVQNIPITINIFSSVSVNTANESNWPRACYFTDTITSITTEVCNPVDCNFGSNSFISYGVGCANPPPLGTLLTAQRNYLIGIKATPLTYQLAQINSQSNLYDTGFRTPHNVPIVLRTLNFGSSLSVPVLSTQTIIDMNSAQLLQSTTRLFGPEFSLRTNPIRTSNRIA